MSKETNPYRLPSTIVPSAYRIFLTPDLTGAVFSGRVEIDVDVLETVSSFALNAIELELSAATVTGQGTSLESSEPTLNEEFETATFDFESDLPLGPATVEISFTGILNDQLHGFYRSTYTDDAGTEHVLATTQFEATDARRAFPCWDEPAFKATYQVNLTIPSHLAAYSNSSVASETDLGNGQRTVSFSKTMKMSTYLVAFIVGPFEASEPIDVRGTPVRAIYPLGKGHLARYALEVVEHALTFFSDYFAIPYPGDKLDLAAIPDFAAGAMENLGLVTFRMTDLLIDPSVASFAEIDRVALVINHEVAHMWFGDLVTMDWWEGIWLNEAFATFMESICTDHFRPQWKKWVGFNPSRDIAFAVDGLHSTRPIEYEVVSPNDCRGMFDVLTYIKGCSVLRMLEQYLGEDTFRDGIRRYLVKHAYANTVTKDLWDALGEASGEPVATIMDTWILQGGYPLVTVADGTISQEPFEYSAALGESNIGELWQVPVLSRPLGATKTTKQVLSAKSAPLATKGVAVVNAGGWGFYRTAYGTNELANIAAHLHDLDELERAVLFSDSWAATLVGRSTLDGLLLLTKGLGDLDEPATWGVAKEALTMVNRLVDDDGRAALASVTRSLYEPLFARLGWEPIKGESEQAGELRALAIQLLGTYGQDEAIIAESFRRFDANELVGDLAAPVLAIVVNQNRAGDLDECERRRKNAATPQDEQRYLRGLSGFSEERVALDAANKCFGEIRSQDASAVLGLLSMNATTGPSVWRLIASRWNEALAKFPPNTLSYMTLGIRTFINDATFADEVEAFHTSHQLSGEQRTVQQNIELMRVGLTFAAAMREQL